MRPRHDWHRTPFGRAILFAGSIRFAIPLLALTAGALIYGTWIESTFSARRAGEVVYGSWWFITLMTLICVTLVLAVVTRYPWRKKHTGFMIVHASLITIIVSGFGTFFTGVEGEMALREGTGAGELRLPHSELVLLSHENGEFATVGSVPVESAGEVAINGVRFEIVELWANSVEELAVKDDGLNELHAVEVDFGHGDGGHWVGQLRAAERPPTLHNTDIRVLPAGETWTPPAPGESVHAVLRHAKNGGIVDIDAETPALGDGWAIESVQRFRHAFAGSDGLVEGEAPRDNPAVQVVLNHIDGSRERHAAFHKFRDSINKKQTEGDTFSEYVLEFRGETPDRPVVVFSRAGGTTTATVHVPGAEPVVFYLAGDGPWTIGVAGEPCTVKHAYGNARGTQEPVEALQGEENKPVAHVRLLADGEGAATEPMLLPWNQRPMIQIGDQIMAIAYAPATVPVPFTIELVDFRKRDYPGSEIAMAFESDVIFTDADGETHEQTIWMNNPLEHKGWKVYQAGFVGGDVSVFQVARDPGLLPMYAGCVMLCAGILVIFYSRAYTHGHPGMPKVFGNTSKRRSHAIARDSVVVGAQPGVSGERERDGDPLEVTVCADRGAGGRTHDADGHARPADRGRAHRANRVG